jgi:hypothetical protein
MYEAKERAAAEPGYHFVIQGEEDADASGLASAAS